MPWRAEGPGPLAGVRVIELGMLLAGPFTGRLLGDMGAEIIKVEPPGPARPAPRLGQGALRGPLALVAGAVAEQEVRARSTCATERGQELLLELVEHERRPGRELPAGDARALEHRARAAAGGQPGARDRARVRLRADRAVRARAPGSRRSPRRWAASATSTASPASRRRGSTSRSATRSPGCSRRRASSPRSTGATRSAAAAARWSTSR